MAEITDSRPAEEWTDVYRMMQRIRRFEEKAVKLFKAGELPGFIHPSVGQEAVSVGMTHDLRQNDMITSTHRGHGDIIAKGAQFDRMFAELYGKETGYCHGRGGSMHIMDKESGILGANGIVGGGIPMATGAGLRFKLDGLDNVVVCFFGDGAVNTGSFHEALNLGSLWDVPVIYVCENNQYAESTPFEEALPIESLAARAASYGMPGHVIDGNDIRACLHTMSEALARARSGEGPSLIQANTYRWYGHHTGDTAPYRTAEELERWKQQDPIARLENDLLQAGVLTGTTVEEILAEIDEEIERAVEFARSSPAPEPATVLQNVFFGENGHRPEPVPSDAEVRQGTFREALQLAHRHALELDPNVIVIGEDIQDPMGGSYKITLGLSSEFGEERIRNTPISEAAIVGTALGAALTGKRPIAEIMYIDFLGIAMDQVANQAALIRYMSGGQLAAPMVIRCQGGAWRGSAAQHSKMLEAWFVHVPGLKMVVPSTPTDAYWLLRWAVQDDNPVIFYEPNLLYNSRGELDLTHPPENLDCPVVRRAGTDVTLVTWGYISRMVLETAEKLEAEGISAEVIDLRRLAPLETEEIVQSVAKTGLCCVVHEAWETGGLGGEIAARLAEDAFFFLDGPVKRIGAKHCPHPFSPILEKAMMPTVDQIVSEVSAWFGR
jgi:2-oxoisovalerate dehydrogenase E1 component